MRWYRLWARSPLVVRLFAVLGILSVIASAAVLGNQLLRDSRLYGAALVRQAADEIGSLVPAVGDQALIGDYTAIRQIARRFLTHANVVAVRWVDPRGHAIAVEEQPDTAGAPEWFVRLLGLSDVALSQPVTVGGVGYGEVSLRLTSRAIEGNLWRTLTENTGILVAAWVVGLGVAWLVLRHATSALTTLAGGVARVEDGDFDVRLEPSGPPDIKRLIVTFNRMTEAVHASDRRNLDNIRRLEGAHRDLARFSEILAHHLKEPVRRIAIYSQILARGGGDGESLPVIQKSALRLKGLLADIEIYLSLSHVPAVTKGCPTSAILQATLNRVAGEVADCGGTVHADDLPEVWVDGRHVAWLFKELLANAITYRATDRPLEIRISARCADGFAQLTVGDNGIGIEPQYFDKIFGVFDRLHGNDTYPGNGIGLAIVAKIVAQAGGRIRVESEPGKGTAFHIALPLSGS